MSKFNKKYSFKKIIISSVLAGFILSILLIAFTLHPHQKEDGSLVVHSHALPIKTDDSNNNHTHSELEFSLLSIFSANLAAAFFIIGIFHSLLKYFPFYEQIEELFSSTFVKFNFPLRGPPLVN